MVTINGEQRDTAGKTVSELLSEMKLMPERTAVMIGGEILPKCLCKRLTVAEKRCQGNHLHKKD